MLLLSLLIAALPTSSGSARAAKAASMVSEESLGLQFYRSVRTTVAAMGMWMAESVRFRAAAPPAASTYEPMTAHLSPEPPFIDADGPYCYGGCGRVTNLELDGSGR